MKAIAQFEEFLEGLVEGSFRRLFGGRLEPVDLARRLGRVMDDNKRVTWGRPLVPNHYQITLAGAEYSDVRGFADSLARELEKFATERAVERGYSMVAAAQVTLNADDGLPAGTFQVRAMHQDSPAQSGSAQDIATPGVTGVPGAYAAAGREGSAREGTSPPPEPLDSAQPLEPDDFTQTRPMRPLEMPLGPTGYEPLYLVGEVSGRRLSWPLGGGRVTVGRGLDNSIVIEDASVSRHHAELTREGGRLEVRDLGSRNGTWLNAARVTAAPVAIGDELAFGAVQLEVSRRAA